MQHWQVNLYTLWFSQIISLMSFGFGIPFIPFYIQELGVTNPDQVKMYTGIINAAPAIAMGIMAPIWGILSDRFGKKIMLLRSMLFASFSLGAMGLATCVGHLVLLRIIQGLFTGTVTASLALVASDTPSHRLSYALGFLSSSNFIGMAAGPTIGGFIAQSVGYRASFLIGGGLMLLDFFLVLLVVKESKPNSLIQTKKNNSTFSIISFVSVTMTSMLLVLFFMRITRTIFNPYLPLYVQQMRSSMDDVAKITGMISGSIGLMTAIAGLTLSRLGDQHNKLHLLKIMLGFGILFSFPLFFMENLWTFSILYSILFFAIGGVEPIVMSLTSNLIPSEKRGALFGVQNLVGSMGWALAPLLGSFISIQFSLKAIFILIPLFLLFAFITVTIASYKSEHVKSPYS